MNAAQAADQAIAKMEAEDAGLIPAPNEEKLNDQDDANKANQDTSDGESKDKPKDDDGDSDGSKPADDDGETPDDTEGEFTADDGLEVEDNQPTDQPSAPVDNAGITLSQAEQKHIADNIGDPLTIRGIVGTGDNAKEVEIKAYSPVDLPADFKYASDREMQLAQNGFQSLDQKATNLLGEYRESQSRAQSADYERRENEGIRADVADLQKEGRFPKFKIQPGQVGFDNDPAAKSMTEVLQIMANKNQQYLEQYQKGRPYRHIGFAEAFEIWDRTSPDRAAARRADSQQDKEDKDRRAAATKASSSRGSGNSNIVAPTIKSGTTISDILARHEQEDW